MSNEPGRALRIAISGKSGCGNSTVSRLVASQLGLRVVNYTFKDLARDRGMSFEEICILAETDSQYDLTIDREAGASSRARAAVSWGPGWPSGSFVTPRSPCTCARPWR